MHRAPSGAETSLEVAALWSLRQDATASPIADNLIFGLPCERANCGFQIERPQRLHGVGWSDCPLACLWRHTMQDVVAGWRQVLRPYDDPKRDVKRRHPVNP